MFGSRGDNPPAVLARASRCPLSQVVQPSLPVEVLSPPRAQGRSLKLVRPKALLDNCFRVMELLYCACCKEPPAPRRGGGVGEAGPGGGQSRHILGVPSPPQGPVWKPRWALGVGTGTTGLGLGTR